MDWIVQRVIAVSSHAMTVGAGAEHATITVPHSVICRHCIADAVQMRCSPGQSANKSGSSGSLRLDPQHCDLVLCVGRYCNDSLSPRGPSIRLLMK